MSTTDEVFDALGAATASQLDAHLDARPDLAGARRDGVGLVRAAAYVGRVDLARHLHERGLPYDAFDAAAVGDVEGLRTRLDADPDATQAVADDGFTALHLAAWFGHDKAAELLLARGADPAARSHDDAKLEPLHSAAAGGHAVIAHLLLDRGVEVDAQQVGGIAPLHSAAHRGDAAMVALLLGRGADPCLATDDGRLAADLATDPEVRALLA